MLLFSIILGIFAGTGSQDKEIESMFNKEGIMLILFIGDVEYLCRKSRRL